MATLGISAAVSFPKSNLNSLKTAATKYPFSSSVSINPATAKLILLSGSVLEYSSRRSLNSSNRKIMASAVETEKQGIKIVSKPSESHLSELGVRSWPKWGCPPSKFPWTYSSKETCYLLEGKVKVYPDGSEEAVEIAAGDLVVFPKGMSCTWDVSEAVDKHYKFE